MRLWHKDLISVLPRQQLLGQWRECCLIAKNIAEKGSPNHILVNKIMDYPLEHFHYYAGMIHDEMLNRGYKVNYSRFDKWLHLEENHCTYNKLLMIGIIKDISRSAIIICRKNMTAAGLLVRSGS